MPELKLPELIVILVILLLLFGGKKLPELSKSIGQSIRELRGATTDKDRRDEKVQAEKAE
ncbi:MAG TPA: twin-arginine translocase TatA/TatE family subunit [Patescibacteria group bacterium]|jgi:sec-independent protein translocase protein TatA|nr:twin-arginine translocase TatA/TatE family subunit [Patescibacteria group bacterium]